MENNLPDFPATIALTPSQPEFFFLFIYLFIYLQCVTFSSLAVLTLIKVGSSSGRARLLPLGSMSNGLVQVSTQLNSNQINDDTMLAA